MWYTESSDGVAIDVLVQPRASRETIGPIHDGRLKVAVKAPPVDGKANARVIAVLARAFSIRRSDVVIKTGATGRRKTVLLRGVAADALLKKVEE